MYCAHYGRCLRVFRVCTRLYACLFYSFLYGNTDLITLHFYCFVYLSRLHFIRPESLSSLQRNSRSSLRLTLCIHNNVKRLDYGVKYKYYSSSGTSLSQLCIWTYSFHTSLGMREAINHLSPSSEVFVPWDSEHITLKVELYYTQVYNIRSCYTSSVHFLT